MHVSKIVMKREVVGIVKLVIQPLLKSEVNNMEQKQMELFSLQFQINQMNIIVHFMRI